MKVQCFRAVAPVINLQSTWLILEQPAQLAASVHHADNLDALDRAVLRVRVQFVQHQVKAFHQHAGGRCDLWPARTHARELANSPTRPSRAV